MGLRRGVVHSWLGLKRTNPLSESKMSFITSWKFLENFWWIHLASEFSHTVWKLAHLRVNAFVYSSNFKLRYNFSTYIYSFLASVNIYIWQYNLCSEHFHDRPNMGTCQQYFRIHLFTLQNTNTLLTSSASCAMKYLDNKLKNSYFHNYLYPTVELWIFTFPGLRDISGFPSSFIVSIAIINKFN